VRILSRYFLTNYLTFYFAILLASNLVIVVVEMMLNFDEILEYRAGIWGVATYLFLRLPSYYLPYLIPVASFGAAFFALGLPARAQELVAIKAGGVSPHRVAVPVLAAAASLSIVTLAINETIVLDAVKEFHRLDQTSAGGDLFQSRASFWYHRGDFLYNVDTADRATRTLHGVSVYERDRAGRLIRSIEAEQAQISSDHRWHLSDATIRRFDPGNPEAAPDTMRVEETVLTVGDARSIALLGADATTLPLLRLHEYIDAMAREGRNATRYRALFHARVAEPVTVLLFALLAIPLALAVEQTRSLAVAGLQGIAIVGLYYGAHTTASMVAAGGIAAAVLSPWILLTLFGGYGAWRFARAPS
jgi:lipopolysaccharide export system permease protein